MENWVDDLKQLKQLASQIEIATAQQAIEKDTLLQVQLSDMLSHLKSLLVRQELNHAQPALGEGLRRVRYITFSSK